MEDWIRKFILACENGNLDDAKKAYNEGDKSYDLSIALGIICRNKYRDLGKWLVEIGANQCSNCRCMCNHQYN